MSYTNSEKIKDLMRGTASYTNGEYDETDSGAPRVIVQGTYNKFSLVYIARSNKWKVFWPFPCTDKPQNKQYFNNSEDMYKYLKSQGVDF